MKNDKIMADVIGLLQSMDPQKRKITRKTLILSELDFDSLTMIDLIDTLKEKYDVDFFEPPNSIDDLRTPESLVATLCRRSPVIDAGK